MNLLCLTLVLLGTTAVQTDWVGGPGIAGPVSEFGSAFLASESIAYNTSGQFSPRARVLNCSLWTKHSVEVNTGIDGHSALFPADFDGDGDLDLCGWIKSRNIVRVYRNQLVETGRPDFTPATDLPGALSISYCLLWAGDLNNDARPDIVVPGSRFGWFENTGSFTFRWHLIANCNYAAPCCDAADVDLDHDVDIVCGDSPLELWRNDGNGVFARESIATGKWWRVKLGDLTGDGRPDLLNSDQVYLNNYGTFSRTPDWSAGLTGPDGHWLRDFDNDGRQDLLLCDQWAVPAAIYWYRNLGTGRDFEQRLIFQGQVAKEYGDGCIAEDIDVDGLPDIAGTQTRVGFLRQFPAGTFTNVPVDTNFPQSHWIYAANLDFKPNGADIDLDLLASSEQEFAWWENQTLTGYARAGELTSSILAAPGPVKWRVLRWDAVRPDSAQLDIWVRTGADTGQLNRNPWQGPIPVRPGVELDSASLTPFTTAGHRYFQYRAVLGSADNAAPVVYAVAVTFDDQVIDVGVEELLAPTGVLDSAVTLTPKAIVVNYGTADASGNVLMRIGNLELYDYLTVAAGARETAAFSTWFAGPRGRFSVKCSTLLVGDENSENDSRRDSVRVTVSDVGVRRLLAPGRVIFLGDTIRPRAAVANFGTEPARCAADFRIEPGYSDSIGALDLAPGESASLSFSPWIPTQTGPCSLFARFDWPEDRFPANNAQAGLTMVKRRTVRVAPDSFGAVFPGESWTYDLTGTNLDSLADVLDIIPRLTRPGWQAQATDPDGAPLTDHNGNRIPDLGTVGPGQAADFRVRVSAPYDELAWQVETTRVVVQSGADPDVYDDAGLRTSVKIIAGILLRADISDSLLSGDTVSYLLHYQNTGNYPDYADLNVTHTRPDWDFTLTDAFGQPLPDQNRNGMPDLGPAWPRMGDFGFRVTVAPHLDAAYGATDTTIVTARSANDTTRTAQIMVISRALGRLRALALGDDASGELEAATTRTYSFRAETDGNLPCTVELQLLRSDSAWQVTLLDADAMTPLADHTGDGRPDLAVEAGEVRAFNLRVTAPTGGGLIGIPDTLGAVRIRIIGTVAGWPGLTDSTGLVLRLGPELAIHNYENPFHDRTNFIFSTARSGRVTLRVYDRTGTLVALLLQGVVMPAGYHVLPWDGTNTAGRKLAPGTYVYMFELSADGTGKVERISRRLRVL